MEKDAMNVEQHAVQTVELVYDAITDYGISVLGALAILIIGWMLAGWVRGAVRRALNRVGHVDETLKPFIANLARWIVLIFVIVAVLNQFGVQTTSIIAVLGAAGLAVGLALQGTLSNVAAGVMLLVLRPFKIGDFIDAEGLSGTVVEIGLFTSELKTADGVYIMAPNSSLWNKSISNFSRNPTRRIDVVACIAYDDDVDGAMALLEKMMTADDRVLGDPAPATMVAELADSSVNINCRCWVKAGDYWGTLFDFNKRLKAELEAAGFSIPFPQQDVYMHQVTGNGS